MKSKSLASVVVFALLLGSFFCLGGMTNAAWADDAVGDAAKTHACCPGADESSPADDEAPPPCCNFVSGVTTDTAIAPKPSPKTPTRIVSAALLLRNTSAASTLHLGRAPPRPANPFSAPPSCRAPPAA